MSFIKKAFCLLIISGVINNLCSAQERFMQISGTVSDSVTGSPLDHASVYLSNTTIGAATSREGAFTLTNIPRGTYNLVISYLGFKEQVIPVDERSDNKVFKVKLHQDVTRLKGVTVSAGRPNKAYWAMFKKYFIGTDENSLQCKILNPEILLFDLDTTEETLTAFADEPLILINKALGYKIYYDLQYFHFNTRDDHLAYFGYPRFEPLHPRNKRQKRIWEQHRVNAYLGSIRHFMKSLITHRLKVEGFKVKKLVTIKDPYLHKTHQVVYSSPLPYDSMVAPSENKPGYVKLKFTNSLYITYDPPASTGLSREKTLSPSPGVTVRKPAFPPSILTLKDTSTYIDRNGVLTDPMAVVRKGAWARKQVADLLPLDWVPTAETENR